MKDHCPHCGTSSHFTHQQGCPNAPVVDYRQWWVHAIRAYCLSSAQDCFSPSGTRWDKWLDRPPLMARG